MGRAAIHPPMRVLGIIDPVLTSHIMCSLKDRQWHGRQHSAAQEEARQKAADELVKQQYSWLGPFAAAFARNMQRNSSNGHSDESEALNRNQVGSRRRASAAAAASAAQQRATIPVERSLVVIEKRER